MSFATIVPRGCGARQEGGLYAECGLGPGGRPLEDFLIDPPLPLPDGLDIVNKAQVWPDPNTGVAHLVIWIGAEHYPFVSDYIEEVRKFGASRRISGSVDISRLTSGQSMMLLAHPRCRLTDWAALTPPETCRKLLPGHWAGDYLHRDSGESGHEDSGNASEGRGAEIKQIVDANFPVTEQGFYRAGPCLYKAYELVPADAGTPLLEVDDGRWLYERTIASTTYTYTPTGEPAESLAPAFFACLPLHGFALVKAGDGTVDAAKKAKLEASGMPWYAADE